MRIIFAMPGNERMAEAIARGANVELGRVETRGFPDGETYVRILSDVTGKDVDIVCTLARPDPKIMPLILVAGALRESGAARVSLTAPYLAYMRQDTRFNFGEALSAVHFAKLIAAHFDSVTTIDPHLHRFRALSEIYTIPTRTLQAAPLLGAWVAANVENSILIGPDCESRQWVAAAAAAAKTDYIVLTKTRSGDRTVELTWPDMSAAAGKTPVLIDDIAASARTLVTAAQSIADRGLGKPVCAIVHALMDDAAYAQLTHVCRRVVSTDTVPHVSNLIGVAPLLI